MIVLVAGAHGAVGQHLVRTLADDGHTVRAMIRDSDQADGMRALGGEPVVADLTDDVSDAVTGADAVIFAAGSGGEAVEAVDRDGAKRMIDACEAAGVRRFVMLSSYGADAPDAADQLQDYLRAKHAADEYLTASNLTYTILRPTSLTNGAGSGTATLAPSLAPEAQPMEVTREDVATALAASLTVSESEGAVLEMTQGETPIREGLMAA